jgi:catechol 2,3-dioxygenase-like lactoylglutathione lyase family enzyme
VTEDHVQGPRRGPRAPRWTHIALPSSDIERSVAWYTRFTPLQVLDRREDADGFTAWLGHSDQADTPFILVLVSFRSEQGRPHPTLAPFAHLGIEMPSRADVDEVAKRAEAEGCLHWAPAELPDPIGYICAITDPDGNVVEMSHGQGVYDKAQEVWGSSEPA